MKEKKKGSWLKWLVLIPVALILAVNGILAMKGLLHPEMPADICGIAPVVMTTDSMSPAIRSGDLMLIEKCGPETVAEGDVILFRDPLPESRGGLVTHRVAAVTEAGFRTMSDADGSADPLPVPAENLIGRYRATVPLLGGLVRFLKTLPGILTSAALAAAGIIVYEAVTRRKEKDADPKRVIDKRAARSV